VPGASRSRSAGAPGHCREMIMIRTESVTEIPLRFYSFRGARPGGWRQRWLATVPASCFEPVPRGACRPQAAGARNPQELVSIRNAGATFSVMCTATEKELETVEASKAFFSLYEGSLFEHQQTTYRIVELQIPARLAYAAPLPPVRDFRRRVGSIDLPVPKRFPNSGTASNAAIARLCPAMHAASSELHHAALVRERWLSQSFLRVHWVAVPKVVRTRRVNTASRLGCLRAAKSSALSTATFTHCSCVLTTGSCW
jgi:hypothetical protein